MNKHKKGVFVVCICIVSFFLLGASAQSVINPDNYKIYKNIDAQTLINLSIFNEDKMDEYKGNLVAVLGTISEIGSNNKSIKLSGVNKQQVFIKCDTKNVKEQISYLSCGDRVVLYGVVDYSGHVIELDVDGVDTNTSYFVENNYTGIDGKIYGTSNMENCVLTEGITYSVPSIWKSVEHDIRTEGIGTVIGYQYCLNEIQGESSTEPESLFVCYFDNATKLKILSDNGETKKIEQAIIKNIMGSADDFKTLREKKSYFGLQYDYYINGSYSSFGSKGYRVEFAFQKCGTQGLLFYMYVYRENKHVDDICAVMRLVDNQLLGD